MRRVCRVGGELILTELNFRGRESNVENEGLGASEVSAPLMVVPVSSDSPYSEELIY